MFTWIRKHKIDAKLQGYKTYIPLLVIAVHQLLKDSDMDVFDDKQLSLFFDIFLTVVAAIFRWLGRNREVQAARMYEAQIMALKK